MNKPRSLNIVRRKLIKSSSGLAAAMLTGMPLIARSQGKGRIVVGTWGGDYARFLNKNVEKPYLIPAGWEVVQDQAGDPERRSKMLAEKRLPRGTTDIQALQGQNMYAMDQAGVLEPIDYSKLKNGVNLLQPMKFPYGVGQMYSAMVGVYNPEMFPKAPTSYKEIFNPSHGRKLALIDIQYQFTIVAAALAAGGSPTNIEPGKKLLLEIRKAGARIYPTNEAFAQGLKTNEFGIGVMYKARTVQWQNAGISVKAATPSEGALIYVSGFVIPKNAPNKPGAYAYLNAMLEPSAQENFAIDNGYNPSITNSKISPELNARIGFTPEEVKKLVSLDYGFLAQNDADMKDWWDKSFKG